MVSRESHLPQSLPQYDESEVATFITIPRIERGATHNSDTSREIHNFITHLRQRKAIIASCGMGAMLLAILYCAITPKRYTADAVLELRGYAPILSTIQSETLFGSDSRKIEYQKTTVAKLKLEGLADAVLSRGSIARDLERYWSNEVGLGAHLLSCVKRFLPARTTNTPASTSPQSPSDLHVVHPRKTLQKYLSLIDIEPVHETNLVHIRATTTQRKLSQALANAHAATFIEHLKRERQDAIQANVELLQTQASELKERVTTAENELNTYATRHKLILTRNNESSNLNSRQIDSLTQMLADSTGKRIQSESALLHARKNKEDEGSFLDTDLVSQLRTNLKQAETEYATLGSQVTAAYPGMRELSAKIQALKRAIRDERSQGILVLQRAFEADSATEASLRQQIEHEKALAQETARYAIAYDVLNKEASSLRDLYQTVLKQAKEIEMSAATTTSNVFVADYAGLPNSPSAPKTNMVVILATCVGFISGILISFLIDSLKDTLTSPEDVTAELDLPLLGSVPAFRQSSGVLQKIGSSLTSLPASEPLHSTKLGNTPERPTANTSSMVAISAPHSPIAEALRTIRANVLLSSADYPPRVIMFTSSIQGEGKTTMLANLAVTLAQANHRTLMIDGDLRLAGLSSLFKQVLPGESSGLSDLLARHIPLESSIQSTQIPQLDILPAGTPAPNPAELVGSASMHRLLSGLKERYDFILLDTPPVMAVADALLLSRVVDSVLFVVRSGATPRSVAREARRKLMHVKARIIGVILNDVARDKHSQSALQYGMNYFEVEGPTT
jgi:succinoglycan biosynthesis transport protein ExoP